MRGIIQNACHFLFSNVLNKIFYRSEHNAFRDVKLKLLNKMKITIFLILFKYRYIYIFPLALSFGGNRR